MHHNEKEPDKLFSSVVRFIMADSKITACNKNKET
jgi:hypothetical protein